MSGAKARASSLKATTLNVSSGRRPSGRDAAPTRPGQCGWPCCPKCPARRPRGAARRPPPCLCRPRTAPRRPRSCPPRCPGPSPFPRRRLLLCLPSPRPSRPLRRARPAPPEPRSVMRARPRRLTVRASAWAELRRYGPRAAMGFACSSARPAWAWGRRGGHCADGAGAPASEPPAGAASGAADDLEPVRPAGCCFFGRGGLGGCGLGLGRTRGMRRGGRRRDGRRGGCDLDRPRLRGGRGQPDQPDVRERGRARQGCGPPEPAQQDESKAGQRQARPAGRNGRGGCRTSRVGSSPLWTPIAGPVVPAAALNLA